MVQCSINSIGDLRFNLKDINDDCVSVCKLSNGGEVEFVNDECVAVVLPGFEQQINFNIVNKDDINIHDFHIEDDVLLFTIDIDGQIINGKLGLSSLKE